MASIAKQIVCKTTGEVRLGAVSFANLLASGELLTGLPTVTADSTTLTISSIGLSTAGLTINGSTVATAKAVQFLLAKGTAPRTTLTITAVSDATPAQTLMGDIILTIVAST